MPVLIKQGMNRIDQCSEYLGVIAAWLYFMIGLMIGYEVLARYLFNAPTIWAQELSQLLFLWATFLGISRALKRDQHIRISALESFMSESATRRFRLLTLVFISMLCLLVVYYGSTIFWDSFVRGRSTGTMLNIPNWWSQAVIPAGFCILFLQSMVEIARHLREKPG